MYIEDGYEVGILAAQHAKAIAEAAEKDKEKARKFLRKMEEDDSDDAVDSFIKELRGEE